MIQTRCNPTENPRVIPILTPNCMRESCSWRLNVWNVVLIHWSKATGHIKTRSNMYPTIINLMVLDLQMVPSFRYRPNPLYFLMCLAQATAKLIVTIGTHILLQITMGMCPSSTGDGLGHSHMGYSLPHTTIQNSPVPNHTDRTHLMIYRCLLQKDTPRQTDPIILDHWGQGGGGGVWKEQDYAYRSRDNPVDIHDEQPIPVHLSFRCRKKTTRLKEEEVPSRARRPIRREVMWDHRPRWYIPRYTDPMNAKETDNKVFFKLVKQQRSVRNTSSKVLHYEGQTFSSTEGLLMLFLNTLRNWLHLLTVRSLIKITQIKSPSTSY